MSEGKGGKYGAYLLLLAGVLLSLLLIFGGSGKKETPAPAEEDAGREVTEAYVTKTEERVRALIGSMRGVGQVKVMVTLEGGYEKEYASLGSSLPLIRMKTPRVKGIAVVCGGGEDASVKNRIKGALCALYGLDPSSVSVSG